MSGDGAYLPKETLLPGEVKKPGFFARIFKPTGGLIGWITRLFS